MQSAANCWVRRTTKNNWRDKWQNAVHDSALRRLQPKITRKTLMLYRDLTAAERSALIQARTGKIGLNAFLYSVNRADTARCPRCSEASETVRHVLIDCPGYSELRAQVWGCPQSAPRSVEQALAMTEHARKTARFLLDTGRLQYLLPAPLPCEDSD
jgi:hypothetical protein